MIWVIVCLSITYVAFALIDRVSPKFVFSGWLWFSLVQLMMAFFTVLGWFLLIPFCLAHAWTSPLLLSLDGRRSVDTWYQGWIRWAYGNYEDGVSGRQALVWNSTGTARVPYMPQNESYSKLHMWLWDAWRAYCWSAWRNSCDNLKYVFAWKEGPYKEVRTRWKTFKLGWQSENGMKVPVL